MYKQEQRLSLHVLKLIGLGVGFTLAALLSPNFLYVVVKRYLRYNLSTKYNRKQVDQSLRYLRRKKFIAFEKSSGKLKLTRLGRRHLDKFSLTDIRIAPHKWDNKWRLVTFDIPEEYKPARHVIREKLKSLGFFHFQRSVFILPFACEKEIQTLSDHLGVEKYVHVLETYRFAGDKVLLKKFNLSAFAR